MENEKVLHTLISLSDFKAILGIDDRDDALSRYCLVTATYSIEQYCRRRLFRNKRVEIHEYSGDFIPLKEYPVRKILELEKYHPWKNLGIVDSELFHCIPQCGTFEDIPFCLELRADTGLSRQPFSVRVRYLAGYKTGEVPADLASACLEMAVWNMARYRGRRIGVIGGSVTVGQKMNGDQLEAKMPERVKELLEPYQRKLI